MSLSYPTSKVLKEIHIFSVWVFRIRFIKSSPQGAVNKNTQSICVLRSAPLLSCENWKKTCHVSHNQQKWHIDGRFTARKTNRPRANKEAYQRTGNHSFEQSVDQKAGGACGILR